ncbi:MAG: tetratricopeptide repeat protein [Pyrinomonadaceae bacterium]
MKFVPLHEEHSNTCHSARCGSRGLYAKLIAFLVMFAVAFAAYGQSDGIQSRVENAASLIRNNRIPEAERQLTSILNVAPNNQDALNLLGTIRAQQGKLDDAETLLTRAAKIDPNFVPVHMNLALLYLLKNSPEKTILELRQVIILEPNNDEANYKLARLLLSGGQTDECIVVIEKAKLQKPDTLIFASLLGDAYLKKGDSEKAEENYRQLIAAQANSVDALVGLAKVFQSRGDEKSTATYLSEARQAAKNSPELLYKIGVAALELKAFEQAQTILEEAVKIEPSESKYLTALGATLLKKSDLFAAEKVFYLAVESKPGNAQAQMYLGYVLYKQKKLAEAKKHLQKTVQADSNSPEPLYYLGVIAQEENEDEQAVPLLEKAIKLSPAFANAHVALGASYLKLKDYVRSQQELELGVKLNPNDSKGHYQLALLYARLKDPKRAQAEMQVVEKLKAVEESEKRQGDTFVIMPSAPNLR